MVAFWAMVLPFALSSLIAHGIMPTRASNGVITLVICTGNGVVAAAVDAVTMEPVDKTGHGDEKRSKSTYCAWAASQPTTALPPLAFLAQPLALAMGADLPWTHTVLEHAEITGLPPSTGPPSTV